MPARKSKTCTKCGVTQPLDEFYAHKGCRDGRHSQCKTCLRAGGRARRDANVEEARRKDRERYANDPARRTAILEGARARHAANRDQRIAQQKARYAANRAEINAQRKAERATNGDEVRAKQRAYIAANRDKVNARRRTYREKNAEALRAYYRETYALYAETYKRSASRRRALFLERFLEDVPFDEILQRDLGVCGICQRQITNSLIELDHVLPLAAGGWHERANVQLAHRACNRKKQAKVNFTLADVA